MRSNSIKPSDVCRAAGLRRGLAEFAEISNKSVQTLNNWFKKNPRQFEVHLKGALIEQMTARLETVSAMLAEAARPGDGDRERK